jgi:hypothetical protein
MKCNYKQKQYQINGNTLKKIVGEYRTLFHQWRVYSGISKSDFLQIGAMKPFEIHKMESNGVMQVFITCDCVPLGQPFVSSQDKQSFMVDTAYILLYIAKQLEGIDGGDYFDNIVKKFIIDNFEIEI